MRLKFIILFAVFSLNIYAQKEFIEGIIITNNLDTVSGFIANKSYTLNSLQCDYKKYKDSTFVTYFPKDIHSFQFNNGKYYISKEVWYNKQKINVFLEYLIKGKLNIYYMRKDGEEIYFVQKENDSLVYLDAKDIYYDYDRNKGNWVISEEKTFGKVKQSDNYKGILNYFISDVPKLQKQVNKISLDHKSLIELAKDYHYAVCDSEDCIIFEKKIKPWILIGITTGYSFTNCLNLATNNDKSFTFNQISYPGLIFSPQFLSFNENSQLRAELYFDKLNAEIIDGDKGYKLTGLACTLPISIQYMVPTKKIKPYINAGLVFSCLFNSEFYRFSLLNGSIRDKRLIESISKDYSNINIGGLISSGITYSIRNYLIDFGVDYMKYFFSLDSQTLRVKLGIGYIFK
jgi:hypothetical protein